MFTFPTTFLWNRNSLVSNWLLTGLVSYYWLDSNANDAHGSNNGTETNVTRDTSTKKLGTASASMNGTSSYILQGAILTHGTNAFTISCWFKHTTTGTKVLWAKWPTSPWDKYWSVITYGDWTVWFRVYDWTTQKEPKTTATYNDWEWHHLIWYKDWTTNIGIKIDNATAITTTWWNLDLDMTADITVGNFTNRISSLYYGGNVDEMWIRNAELSATEMTTLYNSWAWLAYSNFTT